MNKPQANSRRPEKLSAIAEIDAFVKDAGYCFVLNYGSLTVSAFAELRLALAKEGAKVKVVKNSYLAKALDAKGWTGLEAVLGGPTALVAGQGDPAAVAKAVMSFVKKNEESAKVAVKGGQMDSTELSADAVRQLSELPNKDGMRVKLLYVLQAPCKAMLYLLKAKAEKDGGAPAGEAPAGEASAEA